MAPGLEILSNSISLCWGEKMLLVRRWSGKGAEIHGEAYCCSNDIKKKKTMLKMLQKNGIFAHFAVFSLAF